MRTDPRASLPLEFAVAGTFKLERRGIVTYGWIKAGTVRPGDTVVVSRLPGRPTKVTGVGWLSGPGPSSGGPNADLSFEDQALAAEVIEGDTITSDIREH